MDNTFWGVSTKYLQQYLNWYRTKEKLSHSNYKLNAFIDKVAEDIKAQQDYLTIEDRYQKPLSTQSLFRILCMSQHCKKVRVKFYIYFQT